MNAVHATRGVLILWVVLVHWLPGMLGRISDDAIWIYKSITPILRFGTPGFAIVFGLGVGALGLAQYRKSPEMFLKGSRFNTRLVLSGIALLALIRLGAIWSGGDIGEPNLLSKMFYSAIAYYALAMLSMPVLMRVLMIGPNRILTIMAVLTGCMVIHEVLAVTIAPLQLSGVIELLKILLTAKYGFFRMTGFVMVGVAIGYLFRVYHDRPGLPRDLAVAGLTLGAFGFVLLYKISPEGFWDDFGKVLPWHMMIYAGAALLILAGFCRLNRGAGQATGRGAQIFNAAAIASGILALPIFVGHEMVIPAKALLVNLGLPGSIALLIPLGLFVVGLGLAYRRLMQFLVR